MDDYLLVLLRTMEAIALLYAILIFFYTIGWYLLKNSSPVTNVPLTTVSVLVALRNETPHIENLLHDLIKQDYPPDLFEIILADDHSEDGSADLIRVFIEKNPLFNIRLVSVTGTGKKAALSEANMLASGQFVLVTDADCSLHPAWISTMTGIFRQQEVKLILGPVVLEPGTGFFGKLQTLEFMSLIGSTAGACRMGIPAMANGANLGYDRAAVGQLGDNILNHHFASGDDVFLLHAILKTYGKRSVAFALHEAALVRTEAQPTVKSFLQQRMRWVSKSRGYSQAAIILPALIVFVFNLALLSLLCLAFFFPFLLAVYLLLTMFKFMIDYPLLSGVSSFMKNRRLLVWALPLEFIYPVYVVFVAVAGNIAGISWKGRKIT